MAKKIAAIVLVYIVATISWITLGSTINYRTDIQDSKLKAEVGQLWGKPLNQRAPWAMVVIERQVKVEKWDEAKKKKVTELTTVADRYEAPIIQNDIRASFQLEQRQKGLLWYSTYRVNFAADYVFENTQSGDGLLVLNFAFPTANGLYDEFKFEVDGAQVPFTREDHSLLVAKVASKAKTRHRLRINYRSQGLDRFTYNFGEGITEVRNFEFLADTDFGGYDHPGNTLSPTYKEAAGNGWQLTWRYSDLIAGNGIGIEMPQKINPGPMAARISFFAPVSLGFFFFLILIITLLRGVKIHPVNYFFLAASFFAFHLLLAYLVDHISIHLAFLICSAVSIFLVISYMRVVAGSRFAYMEAGLSQFIYLIGFSYAFFFEGFTGLAVTIGSIITLFVVMQMTARVNWTEKLRLSEGPDRGAGGGKQLNELGI